MKAEVLKDRLREQLWQVVDRHHAVLSATLTGSFVDHPTLEGISDIDFVLVLDRINLVRYDTLLKDFREALEPVLSEAGYRLHINPTLGPLKFNESDLAVLHLMLYSHEGHVDHVIQSPFTCLDWQRSIHHRKRPMAEIYPVFGLQPRHFLGSRRSLSDYLKDFRANTVSYRELIVDEVGYHEKKCGKPMTVRDRHEFAYHVIRFLMRNLLKLVRREHEVPTGSAMLDAFFEVFPDREEAISEFFMKLTAKKRALDFSEPIPTLDAELEAFLATFESQFRKTFFDDATRHVIFRHAETSGNRDDEGNLLFLGRSDVPILPELSTTWDRLADSITDLKPTAIYASPMTRCRQSLEKIGLEPTHVDERLREIEYGLAEGLNFSSAREWFPELFAAWSKGEDAPFPDGENTANVRERVRSFVNEHWTGGNSITCSHNVVVRCLVGETLGVPQREWYRLKIPHLAPITFIQTRRFGLFVDLNETVEREIFQSFAAPVEVVLEPAVRQITG